MTTHLFWSTYHGTWSPADGTPKPAWVRDMERQRQDAVRRPAPTFTVTPSARYGERRRPTRDYLSDGLLP
jgi:hypothetical protein